MPVLSSRAGRFANLALIQQACNPLRVQVSALALCKLNKTDVFLRWANPRKRHEPEQDLFWRLDEVPQEALDLLQVGPCTAHAGSTVADRVLPCGMCPALCKRLQMGCCAYLQLMLSSHLSLHFSSRTSAVRHILKPLLLC